MRATDEQLDDAKRVLRADYWQSVRDLADQVREAAKAAEFTDTDGADEYLRETVDGSYWVTYTHASLQVLCWTEHDDAIFDDLGPGEWADASTAYTQIAYYALMADIMDQLGNLDDLFEVEEAEDDADDALVDWRCLSGHEYRGGADMAGLCPVCGNLSEQAS